MPCATHFPHFTSYHMCCFCRWAWSFCMRPYGRSGPGPPGTPTPYDAIAIAQPFQVVPATRPEQQLFDHDNPALFKATQAMPSSTPFKNQPKEGTNSGFDFFRDPLNSDKPMTT